ncbi:hypothetical protein V1264_001508 [Littorina saxatilis]|uniref:Uncharacterized protein n=1 Tax=Littorina saxatilis TaxID=31220 RepID=A0AAN9GP84_9CAEN
MTQHGGRSEAHSVSSIVAFPAGTWRVPQVHDPLQDGMTGRVTGTCHRPLQRTAAAWTRNSLILSLAPQETVTFCRSALRGPATNAN